jgi:hypothetical protein
MRLRTLAACCLALAAFTSSCARPVYQSQWTAAAPEPQPAAAPASAPTALPAAPPEPPAPVPPQDLFAASVRPILEAHCSPCHFPGGKMYERLPFDKPETLASHREGALRRLKGEDRAAFEAWLKTQPAN